MTRNGIERQGWNVAAPELEAAETGERGHGRLTGRRQSSRRVKPSRDSGKRRASRPAGLRALLSRSWRTCSRPQPTPLGGRSAGAARGTVSRGRLAWRLRGSESLRDSHSRVRAQTARLGRPAGRPVSGGSSRCGRGRGPPRLQCASAAVSLTSGTCSHRQAPDVTPTHVDEGSRPAHGRHADGGPRSASRALRGQSPCGVVLFVLHLPLAEEHGALVHACGARRSCGLVP